ncbi:hypothetical protein [Methyloligella solikamskensis]|uniref:Secreted protein n=1 Tax=Methyloligella solikamskensis TaxID=1177756 RepID=A0ABW3J9A4_9HYPH
MRTFFLALFITAGFIMGSLASFGPAFAADDQTAPADTEMTGEDEKIPGVDPDEPLSEQLHEDEGVIDPPPVGDSEIEAPAPDPDPGTTIVIPPPGSPRGDPTVQPK